jgi:hypothetical protein
MVGVPRFHRLEFATFDGKEDPIQWLNRCDQFFDGQRTIEEEASYHMIGVSRMDSSSVMHHHCHGLISNSSANKDLDRHFATIHWVNRHDYPFARQWMIIRKDFGIC